MSKKSKVINVTNSVGYGSGYVVDSEVPNSINGRIFGIVEALGLPEKQEESLKGLIRSAVWNVFENSVFITPERHTEIRNIAYEKNKEARAKGYPCSAI